MSYDSRFAGATGLASTADRESETGSVAEGRFFWGEEDSAGPCGMMDNSGFTMGLRRTSRFGE